MHFRRKNILLNQKHTEENNLLRNTNSKHKQKTNKKKSIKKKMKTIPRKQESNGDCFVCWVSPRGHHRARSDRGQSSSLAAGSSRGCRVSQPKRRAPPSRKPIVDHGGGAADGRDDSGRRGAAGRLARIRDRKSVV